MRFDREQLATLVAIVEGGTFEAAARTLDVTPSAVSQRIKAFEQQLGRVLVVRSKPVRPTESAAALMRLAQQLAMLEHDTERELGLDVGEPGMTIPLAVNADSMSTWLLPALARAAAERGITVDLHRDDQEHTAALLAAGTVMAAVTSQSRPVPGCTVAPLGRERYRAVATPVFAARWFPHGIDAERLAAAPLVQFDRKDELQTRFLRSVTRRELAPPRHFVPASADFALAVRLGMGWGMLPDTQSTDPLAAGELVELAPGRSTDVPLYWQQWNLRSPALDALAAAVTAGADTALVR